MQKQQLIVIDQSFKNYTGHHFNYNYYLFKNLNSSFDIRFYVNRNCTDEVASFFKKKIYKYFLYSSYKKKFNFFLELKSFLKEINYLKKIYYSLIKYNKFFYIVFTKIFSTVNQESYFIKQIRELISLNKDTIFFFHSLSEIEFLELILFFGSDFNKNNNKFYIVYRRDPVILLKYKSFLLSSVNKNYFILTDSNKIKFFFNKYLKIKINLIHIPILVKNLKKNILQKRRLIVGYFGDARYEKGYFNLPELISRTDIKHNFLIQSNSNGFDMKLYKKTLVKLKNLRNVEIIYDLKSINEYKNIFSRVNIVLLPYISSFYKYRTSSIFLEAIYQNKIVIVPDRTWMSQFYKTNVLKKIILKEKNNLFEILNYIDKNYFLVLKDIFKIKKILIHNNRNNIKKIFLPKKKDPKISNNLQELSYIIDNDTINRNEDGNQRGSNNLIDSVISNTKLKYLNKKINILYNQNNLTFNSSIQVINNFQKIFKLENCIYNIINVKNFFYLKNDKLEFELYIPNAALLLSRLIIINYHYYYEFLKILSNLKLVKKIIFVHDVYNSINASSNQFIDEYNYFYIFVSFTEFNKINFTKAKKYLIYPFRIDKNLFNNKIYIKHKLYNYYFISSGSEIDLKNLEQLFKRYNGYFKINLVGDICKKIPEIFLKKYENLTINRIGYIEDLDKIYKDSSAVFLILRFFGTGIPIKLLESIKNSAKVILFGDVNKFGLDRNYIFNLFYANKYSNFDQFVNLVDYKLIYKQLKVYINKLNLESKNKLIKDLKC